MKKNPIIIILSEKNAIVIDFDLGASIAASMISFIKFIIPGILQPNRESIRCNIHSNIIYHSFSSITMI